MIAFYARGFATVTALLGPAGRWARRHPRWSIVITFAIFDLLVMLFGNSYAYAAEGGALAPFLPGGDIEDSAGVPLAEYAMLPLDRGDMLTYQKTITSSIVDFIWVGHLGAIAWMISFLDWLLSFEWVAWLATPFDNLATIVAGYTGTVNWIPFALMITGFVAFIAIAKGRYAGGFIEIVLSCVCAVMAAGILANPVASLTAAGGALETAQDYGSEIAAAVVADDGQPNNAELTGADILSATVTTQLADIFVRTPAQTIAFGHSLAGDCDQIFTDTMKSDSPASGGDNTVRDRVGDCDEEAKNYVQNPNMGSVATAGIISTGGIALFILAMGMALLFIITVFFFLIEAIKTQWNVLIGILPISRAPLWKSLMGTVMGLFSIVAMVVVIAAYLKILISILNATAALGIVMQMQFVNLIIIVLLLLLWKVRSSAKRAGVTMAEQLSKLGLSTGSAKPRDRSMAVAGMGAAANFVTGRLNRPKATPTFMDNRSINLFGAGGNSGAAHTGQAMSGSSGSSGTVNIGSMAATASTPAGGHSRATTPARAVTAPQRAATAQNAANVVYTATKIAKAAPGGPGAMAGQAAISVGGSVVKKKAQSLTTGAARKAIAAPVVPADPPAQIPQRPRAIVVGSDGVGHIQRTTPTIPVPPAPAATKPAVRSPRGDEMRQLLAGAKTGQ